MGLLDSLKQKASALASKAKNLLKKDSAVVKASEANAVAKTSATLLGMSNPVGMAAGAVAAQTALNSKTKPGSLAAAMTMNPLTMAANLTKGKSPTGVPLDKNERRKFFDQQKADRNAAAKNPPGSGTLIDKVKSVITNNPLASVAVAAVGGGLIGAGITAAVTRKKSKKKSTKKSKKKSSSRSRARRSTKRIPRKKRSKRHYGTEAQYKRRGGLDVKYTKNGQPYVIQSNGKARFIKRSR